MRRPTEEQIAKWTLAVVTYEQTMLPRDHPHHRRYGGALLAETRKEGLNGRTRLRNNGLYDEAAIKRLAWGDVDLDNVRAKKAEGEERWRLAKRLTDLAQTATLDRLRAAVGMLEAAANK